MVWRVDSRTDPTRWVTHDGRRWAADDATRPNMIVLADGPQPLTPTGPHYTPTGPGDEVAAYLAAVRLVPAPQVSGEPPQVPRPPDAGGMPDVAF